MRVLQKNIIILHLLVDSTQSMLLSLQAKISANILISPFLYVSLHSLLADMAQLVEQRIRNA